MPYFEHDSLRMHYEIHEGLVPMDTVFLHGNLASNAWWEASVEVWKKQAKPGAKGRLILAEWRGCGKSTGPNLEGELKLKTLGEDYNQLLDHLGSKKANLVGHSTGCLIGLHAMRMRPELYHRAVLLDPVGATGVQFGPEMYEAFTQMSQSREMCTAVMMGTIHNAQLSEEIKTRIIEDAFGVHPLIWHGVPKMLHDVDFRSELPQIAQPTLVLHGEHDTLLPMEASEYLAKNLKNGRFYQIPGRGHSCNVEDPNLFVLHTHQFLFG
jgi:3-oxoadipate enol-lactonase